MNRSTLTATVSILYVNADDPQRQMDLKVNAQRISDPHCIIFSSITQLDYKTTPIVFTV